MKLRHEKGSDEKRGCEILGLSYENRHEAYPTTNNKDEASPLFPLNFIKIIRKNPMNTDFIKLVHKIKSTHGPTILTDARKLRSFLADYAAGKYPGERRVFMLALEEGIVFRLQKERDVSDAFLRFQASHFASTYFVAEDAAQFVIWGWAEVLGMQIGGKSVLLKNASGSGTTSSAQAGQSQASPVAHSPHTSFFAGKTHTNAIGMEFVLIPAGTSVRLAGQEIFGKDEVYQVTITKPFYLGKYAVTQEQWYAVMGENPSKFKGRTHPVEQVSWNDTQDFIKKLNQKESSNQYRLPTEAEWEHAARAGSQTAYCFGDDESQLKDYAWYRANSEEQAHPVGQKKPNAWGLYDMHGNVWEWCQDWYEVFPLQDVIDPQGPDSGARRVSRGGGWGYSARNCRSAHRRNYDSPGFRFNDLGFRLAFSPGR
ncbi:formylglycine-generating enzyme family protein [Desulfosarcina sp. OttesenSCG-928-A07]|nr:formylglycine-generating enzyme family protein [Desulfosarcina sp. OttesenSCG-928-G17]MDL2328288.1 formylglycine-generating enzyme family protein [Desulfosarcina sp. OttesenSCG-928-A07]